MNTAGKTYLDILKEHYPNVVLNELYGYCPAGFFKYGMDMHHPDCSAQCDECWLCVADSEWCENGEYDVPEEWKAAAEQDKPSEPPAPTQTETAMPAVFDYSELDADTAAKLENVTAEIFNVRKEYIFTMAKKVAYAHDLLANHYGGKFGTWCESIGISRDTGNNLVRVAEIFGNLTADEQKNLSQIKPSLLYEVSKPSAPPELVEQVKNGDITTHKEYIELKKELEAAEEHNAVLTAEKEQFHKASKANLEKLNEERERNAELEKQLSEVKESLDISEDDVRKAEERAEYAENKVTEISVKKHELEQRIKELESRPVDVAVDVDELNRRVAEAVSRINSETEHTLAAERRDFADTINAKDDKIWALEDKIKELESRPVPNSGEKIFALKMTMEQYQQLVNIINDSKDKELAAIIKRVKFFNV